MAPFFSFSDGASGRPTIVEKYLRIRRFTVNPMAANAALIFWRRELRWLALEYREAVRGGVKVHQASRCVSAGAACRPHRFRTLTRVSGDWIPTNRSRSTARKKTINVGMLWIFSRAAKERLPSMSTMQTRARRPIRRATCSVTGCCLRHGRHQGAPKSISTGTSAPSMAACTASPAS